MKLPVRILLCVLCAAMVLAVPFAVSSPKLLEDAKLEIIDRMDSEGEDDAAWLRFFLPTARAEEAVAVAETPEYELPIDSSGGYLQNPACYTENGYEDASIRVSMEKREEDGKVWNIAWVEIMSPSQLRTGYAGKKVTSDDQSHISMMATQKNAVVAINGVNYVVEAEKHRYEVRMGEVRRKKPNGKRDVLIIDENGDFHIFLLCKDVDSFEKTTGHTIVNSFMFGPALVKDGEVLPLYKDYGYDLTQRNPRTAFGQLGPLSYVMVVCDGRGNSGSEGATFDELAAFMKELGCQQAYNFDGGNSSIMVYPLPTVTKTSKKYLDYKENIFNYKAQERELSDYIYFASAVPQSEWE